MNVFALKMSQIVAAAIAMRNAVAGATLAENIANEKRVFTEATDCFDVVSLAVMGNRPEGTLLSMKDKALIMAGVLRKALEILDSN